MMSVGSVDCLEPKNGEKMRARSRKRRNLNSVDQPDHSLVDNHIEGYAESKSKKETEALKLETSFSFKNLVMNSKKCDMFNQFDSNVCRKLHSNDLAAAATKLQKAYKSYRTRRSLADCAVVVEELWWRTGFQVLGQTSTGLSESDRSETAISRWARAKTMAATLGKGLSKDERAQKLALRHWLEAIDPRHRYGHNLHLYYNVWFDSESSQPFFFWLDVGNGREVNLETCPRTRLQYQCVKYLGPKEREGHEVIVKEGKLVYKQSGLAVDTLEGTKWIFVLSASRKLYVGQKKKGLFQHSSFLAGGAVTCAGRLVAHNGVVEAIWSYSGHYRPTPENFKEFINFLEELNVDLTNVKQFPLDDDVPPSAVKYIDNVNTIENEESTAKVAEKPMKWNWSTGAGARIGCVREYPTDLQMKALEQVNLSPRTVNNNVRGWSSSMVTGCGPIPSPRPSPRVHLSPRLACMGLTSPKGNSN